MISIRAIWPGSFLHSFIGCIRSEVNARILKVTCPPLWVIFVWGQKMEGRALGAEVALSVSDNRSLKAPVVQNLRFCGFLTHANL